MADSDDAAVTNAIIDPMGGEAKDVGDLWHGEVAGYLARMRLAAFNKGPMFEAGTPDGIGQDLHRTQG